MAIQDVMDHGGPDPIQGFDVDVWVMDGSRSGADTAVPGSASNMVLLGSFTSIVVTIRNATEAYLELNQRIPRYLDGEVQMAWVMEKGMVDLYALRQTFGFDRMRRKYRFNRSPRFLITFNVTTNGELKDTLTKTSSNVGGLIENGSGVWDTMKRTTTGRYLLYNAKVDSWHFAATSGKQVVANQWQGVCEGIEFLDTALGDFSANASTVNTSAQASTLIP